MAVLAARIKQLPRGTQKVVAELSGLRAETITRWKKGQGNPNLAELEAFADALEVSLLYLLDPGRQEAPKLPPTAAAERRLEKLLRDGERLVVALPKALDEVRSRKQ